MKFLLEIRVYCEMKNGTMQVDERVMTAVSSRLKNSCESGQNSRTNMAVQRIPVALWAERAM